MGADERGWEWIVMFWGNCVATQNNAKRFLSLLLCVQHVALPMVA